MSFRIFFFLGISKFRLAEHGGSANRIFFSNECILAVFDSISLLWDIVSSVEIEAAVSKNDP